MKVDTGESMTDRHASIDPREIGSTDGPSIEEKPYKVIFEANRCIGTGHCAAASDNWTLNLETGIAAPETFFLTADELDENVDAAARCPAKKGRGVIHVIDRRTGKEIAPDPHGDGTFSADW